MKNLPNISAQIDEDKIFKIINKNFSKLGPHFYMVICNWLVRAYSAFGDIDKYLILINLVNRQFIFLRKNGLVVEFDNFFADKPIEIDKINIDKPLDILAYQYDIVCNGVELSSGAIRNHIPEVMYKLFSIAGYSKKDVDQKFSGMINALSYGAPPHGGIAPGIDRIVMLLANEKNIREVTMFPMNQNAQDLMMNAPSDVSENQLKELGLAIKLKK